MRTRRIEVPGASITVREWGDDGIPLLYWHGLNPFGAFELNEAGPAWAADGFRVVAFAAPGIADPTTLADLDAYRPSRLADVVVATADRLGIGRFAYVGWSWGASIGVHLGVRRGSRLAALVLLDAGHTDIPGDPRRTLDDVLTDIGEQHERYKFAGWDEFLAAARGEPASLAAGARAALARRDARGRRQRRRELGLAGGGRRLARAPAGAAELDAFRAGTHGAADAARPRRRQRHRGGSGAVSEGGSARRAPVDRVGARFARGCARRDDRARVGVAAVRNRSSSLSCRRDEWRVDASAK